MANPPTTRQEVTRDGPHDLISVFEDDGIYSYLIEERWILRSTGRLDNEHGPAHRRWKLYDATYIDMDELADDEETVLEDGNIARTLMLEEWRRDGVFHRTDGPAHRAWEETENGVIVPTLEGWYYEGREHNTAGPAIIEYLPHPTNPNDYFPERTMWYEHGKCHRGGDAPAIETIMIVGGIVMPESRSWLQNDVLHRIGGPASLVWDIEGNQYYLREEEWAQNGRRHRLNGPAYSQWDVVNGVVTLTRDDWYMWGRRYTAMQQPLLGA